MIGLISFILGVSVGFLTFLVMAGKHKPASGVLLVDHSDDGDTYVLDIHNLDDFRSGKRVELEIKQIRQYSQK